MNIPAAIAPKIKVDTTTQCWVWLGAKTKDGYGRMWLHQKEKMVHRYSYEQVVGAIPDGMFLDHICFNPACANPEHLRTVTVKQNAEHRKGPRAGSKSGVRNVTWTKNRWSVRVKHNGHTYYNGTFTDLRQAEQAAIELRARLFTHG